MWKEFDSQSVLVVNPVVPWWKRNIISFLRIYVCRYGIHHQNRLRVKWLSHYLQTEIILLGWAKLGQPNIKNISNCWLNGLLRGGDSCINKRKIICSGMIFFYACRFWIHHPFAIRSIKNWSALFLLNLKMKTCGTDSLWFVASYYFRPSGCRVNVEKKLHNRRKCVMFSKCLRGN